ncbi:MAG: prepilin peptidase CpaA [Paracoccaceae bacterium]|jgi:prepilin peptidase CpaA
MMEITASQAMWFLPPVLPIALWIAYSDLKFMKITNKSLYVLLAVFVITGLIALPFETFLWRLAQMVVVLAIGFVANALRLIGGGDAKYAAAIALFVAFQDAKIILLIFAAMLVATYVTHRMFSKIGPVRRLTADWASWTSGNKFPMGLALSGTFLAYLAIPLFS